jgi:hypothetical protein
MMERSIQGLESNGGREQLGPLLAEIEAALRSRRSKQERGVHAPAEDLPGRATIPS